MTSGKFQNHASLSSREMEILNLVSTGLTNLEIAKRLDISKRTVDNHISNILTKTKTDNRVELLLWGLQWGKVCLSEINCCTLPANREGLSESEVLSESEMLSTMG